MASSKVECKLCTKYVVPCNILPINHVDDDGKRIYVSNHNNKPTCYDCLTKRFYEKEGLCPHCSYSFLEPVEPIRCSFKFTVSRRGESQCGEIGDTINDEDNKYYCPAHVFSGPGQAENVEKTHSLNKKKRVLKVKKENIAKKIHLMHMEKAIEDELQLANYSSYLTAQVAQGVDISTAIKASSGQLRLTDFHSTPIPGQLCITGPPPNACSGQRFLPAPPKEPTTPTPKEESNAPNDTKDPDTSHMECDDEYPARSDPS